MDLSLQHMDTQHAVEHAHRLACEEVQEVLRRIDALLHLLNEHDLDTWVECDPIDHAAPAVVDEDDGTAVPIGSLLRFRLEDLVTATHTMGVLTAKLGHGRTAEK